MKLRLTLLRVEKEAADYPLEDIKAATGWSQCTPDTAAGLPASPFTSFPAP
jgi:sialate O-acetylesterase